MIPYFSPEAEDAKFIKDTIHYHNHGTMRVQEVLKYLMLRPKTIFQKSMKMALQNNPVVTPQILEAATPNDFRAVMKQILEDEEAYIPKSIAALRDDPETYNKTLLGWAKFVHPQQKEVNVNVEIKEKQDMYAAMYEQYGNSLMAEDAEIIYDEQQMLQSSEEEQMQNDLNPMSVFSAPENHEQTSCAETPSTYDGGISPETQDTTPSWHSVQTIDNPFLSEEEQFDQYTEDDETIY